MADEDIIYIPGRSITASDSVGLVISKSKKVSVNITAINGDFLLVTTGATDKTITLPLTPTLDDVIEVSKRDNGSGKVIVDGNGKNINDQTENIIAYQYTSRTYHYDGVQWVIK